MGFKRSALSVLLVIAVAGVLAGCTSSSRFGSSRSSTSVPQQLPPVQNSSVQSSSLPPLQGQDGLIITSDEFDPNIGDPALFGDSASADGSFVSLDDIGSGAVTTPAGRDLSGSLTASKLLGAWMVSADLQQCRLNLTQTTKSGTNRYRASTPNCEIIVLSLVSSWQLAGSQVQLFDESGAIIGAFQLSGNRFIGTLSGGIAATMEG